MFKKQTPKTQAEARQYAISWQVWASNKKHLSYMEIIAWQHHFQEVAHKFHLVREFKENGII